MAWRISGPGIKEEYFFSLQENDVYMLVQAELEKIELDFY